MNQREKSSHYGCRALVVFGMGLLCFAQDFASAAQREAALDDWFPDIVVQLESKDVIFRSNAMVVLSDILYQMGPEYLSEEQKDAVISILVSEKVGGAMRARAIELLGLLGKKSAKALAMVRDGLFDPSPAIQSDSVIAIRRLDYSSTETLSRLVWLGRNDTGVRREAIRTLGKVFPENAEARKAILQSLEDEDMGVRNTAVHALGEAAGKCPECFEALLTHLPRPDYTVEVVYAIVEFRNDMPDEAARQLAVIFRDSDSFMIQIHAAKALGFFGERAAFAIPLLVSRLGRDDGWDFGPYIDLQENAFDPYWANDRAQFRNTKPLPIVVPWALSQMGLEGEKAIRELTKGKSPMKRFAGIAGLYNLHSRGLPYLLNMLTDSCDVIRLAACDAILRVDPTRVEVVPALEELSHNQNPDLRLKVALLFQNVKGAPPNTVDFFENWLAREPIPLKAEDPSNPAGTVWVILDALSAISREGERSATEWKETELGMAVGKVLALFPRDRSKQPELIPAVAVLARLHPNIEVQSEALDVLKGYGSSSETLIGILEDLMKSDDDKVRSAAREAYVNCRRKSDGTSDRTTQQ